MAGINVIALDDEQNIINSYTRIFFGDPAIKFRGTISHQEALEMVEKGDVKVVLSDQRMPAISGVEFLGMVKAIKPSIVRILITGYADINMVEDAINKGEVYRYINKPWNDDELKMTVRSAIEHYDLVLEKENLLRITQEQNVDLKRLDKLKSDFIANVSHELRTPLTSMLNIFSNIKIGIAGDSTTFPAKLQEYLSTLQRNTQKQKNIVDDLLDIFKLSEEGYTLNTVPASIRTLIEAEVQDLQDLLSAKQISVQLELVDTGPIAIDPGRIGQVIRNLLSNAYKFTPANGKIIISLAQNGALITIRVKDSGIGMEQDQLQLIFDRFHQVEQKAQGKPSGTGLGLAISKRIVELHSGKIWAESEPGNGSTFIIELPIQV